MLRIILTVAILLLCGVVEPGFCQSPAAAPASAAQAAAVLDLSKFPLAPGANPPNHRVIASQSYSAKGKLTDITNAVRKQLVDLGWKELDGSQTTDGYASAMFQKSGFTLSLSVFPGGEADAVSVNLINHGNVDLKQLPVPPGSTALYVMPTSAAYVTDLTVEQANLECRKLLLAAGWQPFGETTVSFFVKLNAVRLQVMINPAPAQGNKTAIMFSAEQLSHDYPGPPDATNLNYADSTGGMLVDTPRGEPEMEQYFRKELATLGWKPTTEKAIRIGFWDHVIFRNAAGELLDLQLQTVEGKTRSTLKFQTAEEVVRLDKEAKELAAKKAAELANKPAATKIRVRAPAGGQLREQTARSLEFNFTPGKGKAAAQAWIKSYEAEGWKTRTIADEAVAGVYELTKGNQSLQLQFVDPGLVIPAEITISVVGDGQVELVK